MQDTKDAAAFLQGRLLLRELVSELTGTDPDLVRIEAVCPDCGGPHGRPRVLGHDLHVSLSRCAHAIVAVAAWHSPLGVDVELRDADPRSETNDAIEAVAGPGGLERWTSVEAVLKADGRGLRVDPREVDIAGDVATLGDARYSLRHPVVSNELQISVATLLPTV